MVRELAMVVERMGKAKIRCGDGVPLGVRNYRKKYWRLGLGKSAMMLGM